MLLAARMLTACIKVAARATGELRAACAHALMCTYLHVHDLDFIHL